MADRQALFKAAKAQRGTATMKKQQIKALRAQKAKANAESSGWSAKDTTEADVKDHEHSFSNDVSVSSRANNSPDVQVFSSGNQTMRPPAPRVKATTSFGSNDISTRHCAEPQVTNTDTQVTHIGRKGSIAPEPAGQSNASSGQVHQDYSSMQELKHQNSSHNFSNFNGSLQENTATSRAERQASTGGMMEQVNDSISETGSVRSSVRKDASKEAISPENQSCNTQNQSEVSTAGSNADSTHDVSAGPAQASRTEHTDNHPANKMVSPSNSNSNRRFRDRSVDSSIQPVVGDNVSRIRGEAYSSSEVGGSAKPGLPAGFFEAKDKNSSVVNESTTENGTNMSKEDKLAEFMVSITEDIKQVENQELAQAESEAQEMEERERFEQCMFEERVLSLKRGERDLSYVSAVFQNDVDCVSPSTLSSMSKKRQKVSDVGSTMAMRTGGQEVDNRPRGSVNKVGDDDAEEDDDDEEDGLDWRSKKF